LEVVGLFEVTNKRESLKIRRGFDGPRRASTKDEDGALELHVDDALVPGIYRDGTTFILAQ